ncbi:MAG: cysteine desulfurase [Nitrospirae bacterium]|nr:cysteine desulfurase [Nitrospirota bacterium]
MKIYFDHNAATPAHPEVAAAMQPFFGETFGNPSSIHGAGREAKGHVQIARRHVAELLGCSPREITFTSGGTEANSTAVLGAARERRERGRHIVVTRVEHSSILDPCKFLEGEGFEVTRLPVGPDGRLNPAHFQEAIRPDTILACVMNVNNETGNIYPIEPVAKIARERGVWSHCDAVQAVGKIPVDVRKLQVDSLSLSAHKFQGPKGIGALYVRRGLRLPPLVFGEQEDERRGGTENVAGIVGMGRAAQIAHRDHERHRSHTEALGHRLQVEILARIPGARLNGPDGEDRLYSTVNISFPKVEGEAILINLDLKGFAVSTGSACAAGSIQPSHVLLAMGRSEAEARSAVRLSLGPQNTRDEADALLGVLPGILEKLWALAGGA